MKRREVLTTATALTCATVAGCGGGEDSEGFNDSAQNSAKFETAAIYTIPKSIVPTNSTQYQVEVVFTSTRAAAVTLITNGAMHPISSKLITTNTSHKVGLALMRCTTLTGTTNSDCSLHVYDIANGVTLKAGKGASVTPDKYRQYLVQNNAGVEYEWNFFSKNDAALLVTVRFIPIPKEEHVQFNSRVYVKVISNSAIHSNIGGLSTTLPKLHETSYQVPLHEAQLLKDSSTGKDTVLLRNHTRSAHYELYPCYSNASEAEKPLLRRRLSRHIDRYCREARISYDDTDTNGSSMTGLLINEILRVTGGTPLVNALKRIHDKIIPEITEKFPALSKNYTDFYGEVLSKLYRDDMLSSCRTLHDSATDEDVLKGTYGVTSTTSVQVQDVYRVPLVNYPDALIGGGARLSFGLARVSGANEQGQLSASRYSVKSDWKTKGIQMGLTIVIKLIDEATGTLPLSADAEISITYTVFGASCRMDTIQAECLIIDLDTRSFLSKLMTSGLQYLVSKIKGVKEALAVIPPPSELADDPVPEFLAEMGEELGEFAGSVVEEAPPYIASGVREIVAPSLTRAKNLIVDGIAKNLRSWGTAELSVLRFNWVNSNKSLPSDLDAFNEKFEYGGWGWAPGAKYITGYGIKIDSITSTGGKNTFMFRVTSTVDFYCLYGSQGYRNAAKLAWSY